jgi:hypothetical protein
MLDRPPDTINIAIRRVDGGVTVLTVVVAEYRMGDPSQGEPNEPVVAVRYDPTPEYINSIIQKYIDDGTWGGPTTLWKMPALDAEGGYDWEAVPQDYVDDNTDKTFRNAWVHTKGGLKPDHDMAKAKEIHRVYLRKARLAEFCRLDNDYRLADEANDAVAKQTIGTERQKFRDVTEDPRIEECKTVEELKALRLEVLVPETKGVSYMEEKMRVSPSIIEIKR